MFLASRRSVNSWPTRKRGPTRTGRRTVFLFFVLCILLLTQYMIPRHCCSIYTTDIFFLGFAAQLTRTYCNVYILNFFAAQCPMKECGATDAYYMEMQTRSADEASTRMYKCSKCGHRWNESSWAELKLAPKQLLWLDGFRHSTRQPEPVILCPSRASPPAAVLFRFVSVLRITCSYMMWYADRWMHLFARKMISCSLSLMLISTASHRIVLVYILLYHHLFYLLCTLLTPHELEPWRKLQVYK